MSKLHKAVALIVLALWGLATMHCNLESLPGFDALKSCCLVDTAAACPGDCAADGCGTIESGKYRADEQIASAPQPLLIPAPVLSLIESPLPNPPVNCFLDSQKPRELPKGWQFSCRTALLPRAPAVAS